MENKKVKYSESDMAALIKQVEDEFAQHLAKAEETTEEVEAVATTEEVVSEETSEQEAPKAMAKTEKEVQEPSSEVELDYDETDFAEMDELYTSMSKSEAEAHMKSLQKALKIETKEVVEETSKEEVVIKSEDKLTAESEEKDESLQKSELKSKDKEIEELKENNQKLEKSLQDLTIAMTKFVKPAPKQKAVTQIQYIAKSEDKVENEEIKENVAKLSISEISNRLSAKIRGGLEKSERDKIDTFYLDGKKDIESIKHLL